MRVQATETTPTYSMGKNKKHKIRKTKEASDSSDDGSVPTCNHVNMSVNFAQMKKGLGKQTFGECLSCNKDSTSSKRGDKSCDGMAASAMTTEDSLLGEMEPTMWVCLHCGHQGCDRNSHEKHALKHYETPRSSSHCIVINTSTWSTWCYKCDDVVPVEKNKKIQECLDHLRKQSGLPLIEFGSAKRTSSFEASGSSSVEQVKETSNRPLTPRGPTAGVCHKLKGLSDLGNTCFFNAVMQNLTQTQSLESLVQERSKKGKSVNIDSKQLSDTEDSNDEDEERKGDITALKELMETCQICYKTYKDLPSLRRHTQYAHGSEFVQCQFCEYEVPANVKHHLKFHEERRHGIKKTSQKVNFQMTPVRSPTPVYVDMPTFNLTPDEEMLFLGRPLQTGSPVELMSVLDRPRPNQTVPSPLTASQTTTAPVPVPDVLVQPAAVQATSQTTQPLPVTITPSYVTQPYLTGTPQPAAVQATSHSNQPLPVTSTLSSMVQPTSQSLSLQPLPVTITPSYVTQPYLTGIPQPAVVQATSQSTQPLPVISTPNSLVLPSSQKTQPLPVTITPSSLWQPYLTETVAPQPTALQSTTQLAQQIPVPINPSTMEKDDIPTSDHSRVLEAPSSLPPNVEGYDPERPWMDGDKRRVEFREEIDFYPPRRIQMTATGRGRLYDWSHLGVPTQETLNDPRFQLCCPPSSYLSGEDAELIRRIRSRARTAEIDAHVVPDGYLGLLKEEKAVLPDGTVYILKSTWIPDPSVTKRRNTATQTEEDTNELEAVIENREIRDNGVQATVITEDTSTQCNILQELLFRF